MGTPLQTTWETIRLELPHCATITPRGVTRPESAQKAGTTKQSRPSGQLQSYRSAPSWMQAQWAHYPPLSDEELRTEACNSKPSGAQPALRYPLQLQTTSADAMLPALQQAVLKSSMKSDNPGSSRQHSADRVQSMRARKVLLGAAASAHTPFQ